MKTNRLIKMVVLMAALIVCCTSCKKDSPEVADTENDYTLYKRVKALLWSTDDIYQEREDVDDNTSFYEYSSRAGDTIRVEEIYLYYEDTLDTKYTIYYNGKEVNTFSKPVDYERTYKFHYTDVNQDGYDDVVVIGTRPKGPYAGTGWIYVYDIKNDEKLEFFDVDPTGENHRRGQSHFTQKQQEQLEAMLGDEFHEMFPECEEIYYGAVGYLYADDSGNIYYELPVLKPKFWDGNGDLGEMIVFFSFDKNTGELNVADCIYMPNEQ